MRRIALPYPRTETAWLYVAIGLSAIANASGLFVTILEPDSAVYASIAKAMVQRNDFVNLVVRGEDWLDKPHLPFWLAAASFQVFGFTTWAYKLPALICVYVGALYTHAFGKLLYDKRVGLVAALVFLSAQHIILSSSDVRAEVYVTAFVIGGVYHFCQASRLNSHAHLLVGSLLAAAAVMSKGIFTLIPIGAAIAGGLLLARRWREAFHLRWLAAAFLILLFITPELYCLWRQFDLHPEKAVLGSTGVSGIRFFFWDSQFGRFFNTGPIRGRGDPLQYFHVVLWAFLPWSIALSGAVYDSFRRLFTGVSPVPESFNLAGGLATFILFSASQFQLPFYLNIAFPFFAIITAAYLLGLATPLARRLAIAWQWLFLGGMLVACVALQLAFRPHDWAALLALLAMAALALMYVRQGAWERWQSQTIVMLAVAGAAGNLIFSGLLVPAVMKYQAGSETAHYLNERYPGQPVMQTSEPYSWELEFYLQTLVTKVDVSALQATQLPEGTLIYGPSQLLRPLSGRIDVLHRTASFPVSRPTIRFLNPLTRDQDVRETWLVKIVKRNN